MNRMDPEIIEKVQLFVTGELEEAEHKKVFDWISASPQNRRYYNELQATLKVADYFRSEKKFDGEQALERLNKRLELTGEKTRTDFRTLFRVAASLLFLVSSYLVFQNIREHNAIQSESVIYNAIESPFGSRTRIYLPDSSYVVLNAGSTLSYPSDFMVRDRRQVFLSGEGYFEVRKNKRSEFVVKVADIEITALGTTFNVKAYPDDERIEATLVEGLLRIKRGDSPKGTVILRPKEKISIIKEEAGILGEPAEALSWQSIESDKLQISVKEVHVERKIDPITDISWKDSEWVIRSKTMKELSVMLERRYNIQIELGDGEVGNFRFSGILKDETLEQVLFAIRSTAPIDYEIDGNKVVLRQNKSLKSQYDKLLKPNK